MDTKNLTLELDMHTHTLASGHAYGTIREMAQAAAERGLKLLGLSEHGPGIPGTCDPIYFQNLEVIPRELYGVRLMFGSEINILDGGGLYMSKKILGLLDYRIAGIHAQCFTNGDVDHNTAAMVAAIQNPWTDIISHPDDSRTPLDYQAVAEAAAASHTLLEVNNSSLKFQHRPGCVENYKLMLTCCRASGTHIILDTDAHDPSAVGDFSFALRFLEEVDFPAELVINTSVEKFLGFLEESHRRLG